jgi:hypothetical protein
VCDDEEASSAFTHPTIPARPKGFIILMLPIKLQHQHAAAVFASTGMIVDEQ